MVLRPFCWRSLSLAALVVSAAFLAGCSARHYRKSADKEVYGIIQNFEQRLFGATNEFDINTPYSARQPKEIPPAEIIEDRSVTNRRIINLADALNLAVKTSRDYQSQKEQLYLTALSLTGARYEFTPQFFADTTPQVSGTTGDTMTGSMHSQVGVSQLLKTGGSLTVALANDLVRYFTKQPVGTARDSAINVLSVNLTQPLLRGFGANNPTVEALTQAERNTVYAVRTFANYQNQFASDIVGAYFGLLTQKDQVRNNYRDYTNRVEYTRYLAARAVDRASQSQVDENRNGELSSLTSYINSLAAYMTGLDAFKIRLGIPVSEQLFLDDKDLREMIAAGLVPVEVEKKAAFAICLERQLDILTAIDKFEDSKRKVRLAADQLRADVSLFGNASVDSEYPDDYLNFDPNKVRYTAGVRINLPVDRLRERNNYRATLVSFESQLRSLSLTLDNYRDRIERGLRALEVARLDYLTGLEALKVAQRRVENNTMMLEAGRATIRDVREAQDQVILYENRVADLYAAHLSARLNLLYNMGVLDTTVEKFWLKNPLKDKLAPNQISPPPLRMPDDQVVPPDSFLEPTT